MIIQVSENGRRDNGTVLVLSGRKGLQLCYLQYCCAAAVGKGFLKFAANRVCSVPRSTVKGGRDGTFDELFVLPVAVGRLCVGR